MYLTLRENQREAAASPLRSNLSMHLRSLKVHLIFKKSVSRKKYQFGQKKLKWLLRIKKRGQNTLIAKVTFFKQLIVMISIVFIVYLGLRLRSLKIDLTLKKYVRRKYTRLVKN